MDQMIKSNSDRFTSIKKKVVPQNIKVNKFSSSGIGNFPTGGLPPVSPTLATAVKDPTLNKKVSLGPMDNS